MEIEQIKLYEKLLNEREELEKDCFFIQMKYMKKFGNLIVKEFELQIETIKYKKMISFCTKKRNYGESINPNELNNFIDHVMDSYMTQLDELILTNQYSHKQTAKVTGDEAQRIRNLYRMIVRLTHPDLHPELNNNKQISELWDKAVLAYKSNNLSDLILVYDQIILIVNKDEELVIEDLDHKIELLKDEIDYIKTTEPYTFLPILKSKKKTDEFMSNLQKNIETYTKYLDDLKEKMGEFHVAYEA